MPSRRDALKAGGLAGAGILVGGFVKSGAWAPAPWTPDRGAWPTDRYGLGNTGHNPHATPPRERPRTAVSFDAGGRVSTLVARAGRLYTGTPWGVRVRNVLTDQPRGSIPVPGDSLALVGETLAAASHDGVVTVVDATTHEHRWQVTTNAPLYSVLADRDTVYAAAHGTLHAFDRKTGRCCWQRGTRGSQGPVGSGFADGTLVGSVSGPTRAFDARGPLRGVLGNGPTVRWEADPPGFGTTPVAAGDRVLVGATYCGDGCGVLALDAASGDREWRTPEPGETRTVAVDDERAYVAVARADGDDGNVHAAVPSLVRALSLDDGSEAWHVETDGQQAAPVVANDTVYVGERYGDENAVIALDAASGERRWSFGGVGGVTALAAANEFLLVGYEDGAVRALEQR